MTYADLEKEFLKFKEKHKDRTLSLLSIFFRDMRQQFNKFKMAEWEKRGHSVSEAQNRTRQGWVSFLGSCLEKIIALSLEEFCEKNSLGLVHDKNLRNASQGELDLVRRSILVHFGDYSLLPDADMVVYRNGKDKKSVKVICILSVKNSFRERYAETPFWKLKLKENSNTEPIKVFMITPDNDDEISFVRERNGISKPTKARIVMEYELDGIYLARERFDSSGKVKSITELQQDILGLI